MLILRGRKIRTYASDAFLAFEKINLQCSKHYIPVRYEIIAKFLLFDILADRILLIPEGLYVRKSSSAKAFFAGRR